MNEKIINTLEFDKIRNKLADKTVSAMGRALALELMPEKTEAGAQKLVYETMEAETLLLKLPSFPIMSFNDISGELRRLRSGAPLSCSELLSVNLLMKASKRASEAVKFNEYCDTQYLPELAEGLFYSDSIINRIENSIIGENEVSDSASPTLAAIRRKMRSENDSIRSQLQAILRNKDLSKYLQDAIITMRDGRYVVPVKQEYRSMIRGIVHGESGSGATLFIEPMGVVEANNALRILEEQERKEIEAVLASLSALLMPYTESLASNADILAYLDLVFAKAALADEMHAAPPQFNNKGEIRIINGRHPLIDADKVIPVSIELPGECRALIITGPNTGGKTVTLKLVGLFCVMAQSGMYVPALWGVSLPIYKKIFADIGDEQSIEQSLSTFSSHMTNIVRILRYSDKHSLVLLDELGAGTDPEEGAALALAVLEELSSRGLKLIATTHYGQIKSYAMTAEGFLNASMDFDVNSLMPTYRLIMGIAGASNALLISKRLGVHSRVIERAENFMSAERIEFDKVMREAERKRTQAESELKRAQEMQARAIEIDKRAKQQEEELAERRRTILEKAREDALKIVNDARDEAEEVITSLKKLNRESTEADRTREIDKSRKRLSAKKETIYQSIKAGKKPHTPVDPKSLRAGDPVRIVSLEADGTVVSVPDSKGMVDVQAGILKMNVHYSDLELRIESGKKTASRTSKVVLNSRKVPLSINLLGRTVEEALVEVDKYLDDAVLSGVHEVSIVHGKGTGALRSGIHTHLRKHPHVQEFRLGRYGEGETGVTVVTLK